MPRADYRCPRCGCVDEDVPFSSSVGALLSAPSCPYCSETDALEDTVLMEWIPFARFDAKSDGEGGKGFQKFTVHREVPTRDGLRQVEETVDSLHTLRRIEHDSEQRYKDGEGEPLRFRAYAQSGSNMDRNSFGESGRIGDRTYDSGQQPQKKANIETTRHGATKPKVPLGPGLRRASTPLKG